jgi:hypothetical protein
MCAFDEAAPSLGECAAEVAIFKPTIKHKPLVELQVTNGGSAERHIAAVRTVWLDAGPRGAMIDSLDDTDGFIEAQAWSLDTVIQDAPSEGHDLWFITKSSSCHGQPVCLGYEIVIEEYNDIDSRRESFECGISLRR